ncbi:MAG TPA: DUF2116 family Zn-ribbon domain-containing protein [Dehalococcoidia bacterium]|nr:DUF2116 family Zn-ribbon domain-containing protein [Dehalococcoidia bacterium]
MERQEPPSISNHRHCPICGRSIPPHARFCSIQCEQSMAARSRSQRRTTLILVGLMALIIILWLYFSLRGGG